MTDIGTALQLTTFPAKLQKTWASRSAIAYLCSSGLTTNGCKGRWKAKKECFPLHLSTSFVIAKMVCDVYCFMDFLCSFFFVHFTELIAPSML